MSEMTGGGNTTLVGAFKNTMAPAEIEIGRREVRTEVTWKLFGKYYPFQVIGLMVMILGGLGASYMMLGAFTAGDVFLGLFKVKLVGNPLVFGFMMLVGWFLYKDRYVRTLGSVAVLVLLSQNGVIASGWIDSSVNPGTITSQVTHKTANVVIVGGGTNLRPLRANKQARKDVNVQRAGKFNAFNGVTRCTNNKCPVIIYGGRMNGKPAHFVNGDKISVIGDVSGRYLVWFKNTNKRYLIAKNMVAKK